LIHISTFKMLSTLLPAGTRLYMESPLGVRLSGITLDYGRWDEPLFTFPDADDLEGRERISAYHVLGYYRRYVSPSERFRAGNPKDHLFVLEGQYKGQSLSAITARLDEGELAASPPVSAPLSAAAAEEPPLSAVAAEEPPLRAAAAAPAEEPPAPAPAPAPAPVSPIAAALERIRVREAALLAELADLEEVRIAQERLAALELRVAAARAVLNSI